VSYLSKGARSALIDAAYILDDKVVEARVYIRQWLARLASEVEVLGPLVGYSLPLGLGGRSRGERATRLISQITDSKMIKRLTKSAKDEDASPELVLATMALLKPAYMYVPLQSTDQTLMPLAKYAGQAMNHYLPLCSRTRSNPSHLANGRNGSRRTINLWAETSVRKLRFSLLRV
jgi:hypothetical protein